MMHAPKAMPHRKSKPIRHSSTLAPEAGAGDKIGRCQVCWQRWLFCGVITHQPTVWVLVHSKRIGLLRPLGPVRPWAYRTVVDCGNGGVPIASGLEACLVVAAILIASAHLAQMRM